MTRPETVEALAEHLKRIYFDGTGCGTTGVDGCSNCCGPSPMSAHEIATALLDAIDAVIEEWLLSDETVLRATNALAHARRETPWVHQQAHAVLRAALDV